MVRSILFVARRDDAAWQDPWKEEQRRLKQNNARQKGRKPNRDGYTTIMAIQNRPREAWLICTEVFWG